MDATAKKILVVSGIAIVGIIAVTIIARRLGGKPYGIWIYK